MKKYLSALLGIGGILLFLGSGSLFIVDQRSQAIVLQFGELKRVITTPGLKMKIPFIQEVIYYDKRVLNFDLPAIPLTTGDQKRIIIDTYTRYQIEDPVLFFQTIKPADEQGAGSRLEALISSTVRNVIGKIALRSLLTEERAKVMQKIHQDVAVLSKAFGINVIDIRIIQTELPIENRKVVFDRMNLELTKIANANLAEGEKDAQETKSKAEKKRTVIIAEAQRDAQKIKAEGEAKALELIKNAVKGNIKLYDFLLSLDAYEAALEEDTMLVLSTESELFKYFTQPEKSFR